MGNPLRLAQSSTAGIKIATTGVLFIKALITAVGQMIRYCADEIVLGMPSTFWEMICRNPVSRNPAATINNAAIVITPSFANPSLSEIPLVVFE